MQLIKDASRMRFVMVPNFIVEMPGMTNTAFRLYCWYKRVCGDTGECYQSQEKICERLQMSKNTITTARDCLEQLGLIEVRKTRRKNGSVCIRITIIDVWDKNEEFYADRAIPKNGTTQSQKMGLANPKNWDLSISISEEEPLRGAPDGAGRGEPGHLAGKQPQEPGTKKNGKPAKDKPVDPKSLWCERHANRLQEMLTKEGGRQQAKKHLVSALRVLVCRDEIPPDRVLTAIQWHEENYQEEFTPQVFYPMDFASKFEKIWAAMRRDGFDERDVGHKTIRSIDLPFTGKKLEDSVGWDDEL